MFVAAMILLAWFWCIHGDPTGAAFLVAEGKLGVFERRERRFERTGAVPFTSQRQLMSTLEIDHGHGDRFALVTTASSMLWLSELRKCGARPWAGRRPSPTLTSTAQR